MKLSVISMATISILKMLVPSDFKAIPFPNIVYISTTFGNLSLSNLQNIRLHLIHALKLHG